MKLDELVGADNGVSKNKLDFEISPSTVILSEAQDLSRLAEKLRSARMTVTFI